MERAIYALAAAVLLHAGATYWAGPRYVPADQATMVDSWTGTTWHYGHISPGDLSGAAFHEIAFDPRKIRRAAAEERAARRERFEQRLAEQP